MLIPEYEDNTVPLHKYNFLQLLRTLGLSELCGMKDEQAQRKIIAAALFPATSSTTVPSMYEQLLTEYYIEGRLTICQSVELLEEYHRANMPSGRRQCH